MNPILVLALILISWVAGLLFWWGLVGCGTALLFVMGLVIAGDVEAA